LFGKAVDGARFKLFLASNPGFKLVLLAESHPPAPLSMKLPHVAMTLTAIGPEGLNVLVNWPCVASFAGPDRPSFVRTLLHPHLPNARNYVTNIPTPLLLFPHFLLLPHESLSIPKRCT
jgi:hypothetical protein